MARSTKRRFKSKSKLSKAVKREVKKIAYSTQETKHHRVENSGDGSYTTLNRAGVGFELNSVDSQGVNAGQFVGQEIRQMGISIKAILRQEATTAVGAIPEGGIVRFMVVQFTQAFQSKIQAAKLAGGPEPYEDMFYATGGDQRLVSPTRESHVERKYVDKIYLLDNLTGHNRDTKIVSHFIKLGMKKYNVEEGVGGAPAPDGSDKIYLCLFTDVLTAGQNDPDMMFASTLWYKDA